MANVVAIPDADWTPEMLVGLAPGVPKESQFARRLAENGCRVLVPALIDRKDTWSGNPQLGRMTNQPHREFVYRMAYEMGRHIIGYEVQKVLAAVDWLARDKDHPPDRRLRLRRGRPARPVQRRRRPAHRRTPVVSGYFGPREELWQEPIYRNVWGLLREFGDAELAAARCAAPAGRRDQRRARRRRAAAAGARAGRGAAPGRLAALRPTGEVAQAERPQRSMATTKRSSIADPARACDATGADSRHGLRAGADDPMDAESAEAASRRPTSARTSTPPPARNASSTSSSPSPRSSCATPKRAARRLFWSKLDTSSLEKYAASHEAVPQALLGGSHRQAARADRAAEPAHPADLRRAEVEGLRGRRSTSTPTSSPTAFCCVPKDLKPGEKRPVVVCQHGLEGRPQRRRAIPKEKTHVLQLLRRPARRPRLHRLRAAEPVHRPGQVPRPAAQGQPARAVAVLVHRPPARAHPRLAGDAAVRRCRPDRVLRPVLRRQDGDARAGPAAALLPVDLLRRLQRVDLEERLGRFPRQLHVHAASTRCPSSTWATRSTTPRWRP